ncbi:MAG: glutamate--tRNA ligase [Rhodospirillales bacterium]|nr:glutamate--tRNA ligase [Alphaproteobacteria bacterium]MBL6947835.1 glutamate--tRNA ligase [Rhodospirillales bacterium]
MTVVTRFAPSPTGFLHIGGARTALYNWLFAKHHAEYGSGGRFLLRIEDTDRKRSSDEAVAAIYEGLKWLGLDWDGDAVSQFSGAARHAEIAEQLLAEGKAYKCYCSAEELQEMRDAARAEGRSMRYDGRWRDRDPADAPEGVDPVIRMKAPLVGETVIQDLVQGEVTVANEQLDDMILLRANGTPTYMLAVVVDDHDMGVTHVIRGDDHLTNAFRQTQIYSLLGWDVPAFAHIPLIHGADGAKLSKRHGALGVEAYRDLGFLPEAVCNYLLRLGWSHGDDEIISREQAVEWFGLESVGRAAARFDMDKLTSLNGHYIRESDDARLLELVLPRLRETLGEALSEEAESRLLKGMAGIKERAKTLIELAEGAEIYARARPFDLDEKAQNLVEGEGRDHVGHLRDRLRNLDDWNAENLQATVRGYAEEADIKLGKAAQPLRAALSGRTVSPGIFEVMEILGREETLGRLSDFLERA